MDFKKYAVILKQYQGRGNQYVGQLLLITANAKLFENYLAMFGITVTMGIIIGFSFTVCLGWVDYHYGIWRAENDYVWRITPLADETSIRVKHIEEMMEKRP